MFFIYFISLYLRKLNLIKRKVYLFYQNLTGNKTILKKCMCQCFPQWVHGEIIYGIYPFKNTYKVLIPPLSQIPVSNPVNGFQISL